jgi:hypothetical protein
MVNMLPTRLVGVRDQALLLGFAAALRCSELVGLDVTDVAFPVDGVVFTLRRSKTDQEGASRTIGVPYGSDPTTSPVRRLRAMGGDPVALAEEELVRLACMTSGSDELWTTADQQGLLQALEGHKPQACQ